MMRHRATHPPLDADESKPERYLVPLPRWFYDWVTSPEESHAY